MELTSRRTAPAIVGLLIAWGGTAVLVSPVLRRVVSPSSLAAGIAAQLALWLLWAAILCIVLFWEKRPLTTIWLERLRWPSWAWAAALTAASIFVLFPITEWIRTALSLPGYAMGMETALQSPLWLRLWAVVTAGIVEETLFRGFAVTRLLELGTGAPLAVLLASAVFAALHLPVWGPGPSLAFFLSGVATTTFFVWRKDLATMILAHIAIDAWGLVITPALSRWWL